MSVTSLSFSLPNNPNHAWKEIDLSRKWSCNFVIEYKDSGFSSTKAALRVVNSSRPSRTEKERFVVNLTSRILGFPCRRKLGCWKMVVYQGLMMGVPTWELSARKWRQRRWWWRRRLRRWIWREREFGPIMKLGDVVRETEKFGASLPSDLLKAAKTIGIKKLLLMRYLELQATNSFVMRWSWKQKDENFVFFLFYLLLFLGVFSLIWG